MQNCCPFLCPITVTQSGENHRKAFPCTLTFTYTSTVCAPHRASNLGTFGCSFSFAFLDPHDCGALAHSDHPKALYKPDQPSYSGTKTAHMQRIHILWVL